MFVAFLWTSLDYSKVDFRIIQICLQWVKYKLLHFVRIIACIHNSVRIAFNFCTHNPCTLGFVLGSCLGLRNKPCSLNYVCHCQIGCCVLTGVHDPSLVNVDFCILRVEVSNCLIYYRWTKSMLRGRGGCYKHSFYGIESHRCMEMTPSLACANK